MLIKGIAIAIGVGIVWMVISYMFFPNNKILIFIGFAVLTLPLLYMAFFSENIKVEIEGSSFRFYKKGKLKHEIELKDCNYSYTVKHGNSVDSIVLKILPADAIEPIEIDCEALGDSKFYDIIADIEQFSYKDETVIKAAKKEV